MQEQSGSDLPPVEEFIQTLTLLIALAKQGSHTGVHTLEKSTLSVTKLKYKERLRFSNVIGKT